MDSERKKLEDHSVNDQEKYDIISNIEFSYQELQAHIDSVLTAINAEKFITADKYTKEEIYRGSYFSNKDLYKEKAITWFYNKYSLAERALFGVFD